uniref:Uncharacterized protein n=1 Tax=Setaria viridis TaxID=4556 RepID=A0A4U6T4Y2_SETVI|nr:hypothetical protein SEVIR_9G410450v2 [Setaria viridis]
MPPVTMHAAHGRRSSRGAAQTQWPSTPHGTWSPLECFWRLALDDAAMSATSPNTVVLRLQYMQSSGASSERLPSGSGFAQNRRHFFL